MSTPCPVCQKPVEYSRYCSIPCASESQRIRARVKFEAGLLRERDALKKFVVKRDGERCQVCAIETWMEKPVSFHLDHTDGNASNNHPSNLRLLCPTCHSQTPFYGNKNKGRGRKSRGLPEY
jgi:5-methylcytosine-specific restriction endonuclease McrA